MVSSVNGKITKGDNRHVRDWSSKEDAQLFTKLKEKNNLTVIGSKTYEAARRNMRHRVGQLRIVLTTNPKKYRREQIAGQLEFTKEKPVDLVNRLEKKGHQRLLLLGGGEINALFFQANLVDELILTIEPKIFGRGKNLVENTDFQAGLKLKKVERLNSSGSLRLFYEIIK
ncbi:dihydrofolate reductase [Candidatus Microgenomates bacterium]|nr:dihydrofolate reductase [Candidatus Microgenomates bacterium]